MFIKWGFQESPTACPSPEESGFCWRGKMDTWLKRHSSHNHIETFPAVPVISALSLSLNFAFLTPSLVFFLLLNFSLPETNIKENRKKRANKNGRAKKWRTNFPSFVTSDRTHHLFPPICVFRLLASVLPSASAWREDCLGYPRCHPRNSTDSKWLYYLIFPAGQRGA